MVILLWCLSVLAALPVQAQLPTARVTGTVSDPSGAVIPGATVTVTNVSNGFTYKATTNNAGQYIVVNLHPATYTIGVKANGFKTYVLRGVTLEVNQAATENVVLRVGSPTQTVEVTSAPPLLQAQNAQLGQTVTGSEIRELPLVGRNASQLVELAPGVAPVTYGSAANNNSYNIEPEGMRYDIMDVILDGVTETGPDFEERDIEYVPSIDALQEFKVEENNFSADKGFSGSTIVTMVMRSGTNQFHGTLYEFDRNNIFDSNNFFSNEAAQPIPPLHWNDFGGTIGGPIQKNKTFFFFDYEGTRESSLSVYTGGVPTGAEKTGDFSSLCGYYGGTFNSAGMCSAAQGQLWDPYTGSYNPTLATTVRSGFIPNNNLATYQSPGNALLAGTPFQLPATPGNLINPSGRAVMSYFPSPNLNVGLANYNPYVNYTASGASPTRGNTMDIKVDHLFGANTHAMARLAYSWGFNNSAPCWGNAMEPCSAGATTSTAWNGEAQLTHNFGANKVLTLTQGLVRGGWTDPGSPAEYPNFNAISALHLPSYFDDGIVGQIPTYDIGEYAPFSGSNSIGEQQFILSHVERMGWDTLPTLDWIIGRHDLKIGAEFRISQQNTEDIGYPDGFFDISQTATTQYQNNTATGGDAMASLLMGSGIGGYGSFNIYEEPAWTAKSWSLYVEDNWRATNKLTLNLGLRYDLQYPSTERFNRGEYFDPSIPNPLKVPGLSQLYGGDVFTTPSARGEFPQTYWGAIQPRFGLAYRLNNKTVVRGGAGLYYEYFQYGAARQDGSGGSDGYMPSTPWVTTYQNNGATPANTLTDPFPGGPTLPTGNTLGALTYEGLSPTGGAHYPGWGNIPSNWTWNVGIERQLPGAILVEADYVGQKGTHLLENGYTNLDVMGPEVQTMTPSQLEALDSYVPNPFYGYITNPSSCLSGPTVPEVQLRVRFPEFCGTNVIEPPWGNSEYNAFQLRAEKRISHGLQFFFNYTFSKSMDEESANGDNVSWIGGATRFTDPNNLELSHGLSDYDDPNIINVAYTYTLPFGQGRHWGSSWKGPVNAVLGGWETSGIWIFDTGNPLPISWNSCGTPIPTYGCQQPNGVAPLRKNPGVNLQSYFANGNQAFSVPAPWTLGTAAVESNVFGPGARNFNLAIYKNFSFSRVREGMSLQLRLETLNAFNHPQFGYPNSAWQSPTFGVISSQLNTPRQIQLGAKFYF
ncbi:MAG: carboxypeptidase regulatory-like domain-containing protein [Terriglobia bacterium]